MTPGFDPTAERLKQLEGQLQEKLRLLTQVETRLGVETSPLERERLRQDLEHIRREFTRTREEFDSLENRVTHPTYAIRDSHDRLTLSAFHAIEGALSESENLYLERPADNLLDQAISRPGIITLQGPHQIGKTSLIARRLAHAREIGATTFLTNLQIFSPGVNQDIDLFYFLCHALRDDLQIDIPLEEYSVNKRVSSYDFVRFLRTVKMKIPSPVIWAIDELDVLIPSSQHSEFMQTLQYIQSRYIHTNDPILGRINIILSFVSSESLGYWQRSSILIPDGRIHIRDFTIDQVASLNRKFGCPIKDLNYLEEFFMLTGGSPYLTSQGLHLLRKSDTHLDVLKSELASGFFFRDHLYQIARGLSQEPEIQGAFREFLRTGEQPSQRLAWLMETMGLVKYLRVGRGGFFVVRCRLYVNHLLHLL